LKNGVKRIGFLLMLSVFVFISTSCRHSPLLEQLIYVDRVEVSQPEEPPAPKEEKAEPEKAPEAAENNGSSRHTAPETIPEGPGETEFIPEPTEQGGPLQIVTGGGIAVEVPESAYMVTTISEPTRNPHWKTSIVYDSDRYTGERQDGFFEGVGTYVWDDGEKYEGEWRSGMFNGTGTYTWAAGDKYEGEWKSETFHGQGKYTWASGSYYEGEWYGGVKQGQRVYSWANGDKYTGEWEAGVKEGFGTYTWADGSVYEGEWKYGIKEGSGTYRGVDGTTYQGLWAQDKFVGN